MTKIIRFGYTDYPLHGKTGIQRVKLLSYDNDKYVKIEDDSGNFDEIKRGYIWKDPELTKRIPEVHWFVLGGGKIKNYSPRPKIRYYAYIDGPGFREFKSRKDGIRVMLKWAKSTNFEQWLYMGKIFNDLAVIYCYPDGSCILEKSGV